MTPTDLLTPAEVAARLGMTPGAVVMRLARGTLPGVKVRGRWHVKAGDLAAFLAREGERVAAATTPVPTRLPVHGGRPGDGFRARAAALRAEAADFERLADLVERDGGRWSVAS